MRRILPSPARVLDRARSARPRVAVWLAACSALASVAPTASGQAPGPESFAVTPRTPLELWDAVDYLVRVGQADQAVPYLNAFLKGPPDDATLLEIRDRYGPGSILRLGDFPATRARARPLMDMLAAASRRRATDPERIARFIAALSRSREERAYALDRLREAGPYAVPPLIEALRRPGLPPEERAQIVAGLGQLDPTAVPALLSVLDAPDAVLAAAAAEALGRIGDPRAVPSLTYHAARAGSPSPLRAAARAAIGRLTGRPLEAIGRSPARVLADEARKYHLHAVEFPADRVEIWQWADDAPTPRVVSRDEAEELLGLRFARQALELDPADVDARVVSLSLALEKAVGRVGLAAFPANDPAGAFPEALAAGPDVLGRVLRTALADGHSDLAAVAAYALGRVTDRDALGSVGSPSPLVEALGSPDRRVQFAAAQALVGLEPAGPFPGSSRVVPILARFAAGRAAPRAVVVDSNLGRGGQTVAFLKELGYDPQLAPTGDQGFRLAAGSADVELILLEPSLPEGSWRLIDTLANLRADARTAGIPVLLTSPLDWHDRLRDQAEGFPRVGLIVTPANAQVLRPQLERELGRMGGRPLSEAEREAYARAAAELLARISSWPGSPFGGDLPVAEPALVAALNGPAAGPAVSALGDLPSVDAQRQLADVLLDASRPAPIRLGAADRLTRSIRRFGPLVSATQEQRLLAALDGPADPALRAALEGVIDALRPPPATVGRRPRGISPTPPAAPEATSPAPAPVPAPEAEAEPGAEGAMPPAEVPAPEPGDQP